MGSITKIVICCTLMLMVIFTGCKSPFVASSYIYLDQQNNPDKAKEALDKALEQNPDDPEAHYMMGRVHLAKFQYVDMVASFNHSLEISNQFKNNIDRILTDLWKDFYSEAMKKFNEHDYDAALENLQLAESVNSARFETFYIMGLIHEIKDSMELAAENYTMAIEKNSGMKDLNTYYNLANVLFRLEKWDECLQYSQVVADEATADSLADLQMDAIKISAVSLSNLDRSSDALEIYNDIIAASPGDPNPFFDRALLHIELGDTAKAIQDFEQVVSLDQSDIDALKQLGWFYLEGGTFINYEKALDYYQLAYDISPDEYIINQGMGIALIKLDQVEEAKEYLDRAKELRK